VGANSLPDTALLMGPCLQGEQASRMRNTELMRNLQFHVDNLSSAHIYYRLQNGQTWDAIPADVLTDCAQLTKANSIEGGHVEDCV